MTTVERSSQLLSKRQLQVAYLRCEAFSFSEIAAQLHIETRTVESHINTIRTKIEAKDLTIEFLCRCVVLGIYPKNRLFERYLL